MSLRCPLQSVLDRIDAANAADPAREMDGDGETPAALLYGKRMSAVLAELEPNATDVLQIAVRGQHIERWTRPRKDYPEGRTGYLAWRRDAGRFHAGRVAELMALEGYDDNACARAAALIRKEKLKSDRDAQILEDVACLVFMRWYFNAFAGNRTDAELFDIVAKTARKMSARGRAEALKLPLPPDLVPAITQTS